MAGSNERQSVIVRTSFIGIAVNVILAATKAFVGIFSNSIAIVLDALNNLSDALSSIITIIGTKLSLKPATKKHPFGNGRTEYLSALIISMIILYAGITSFAESVKKIIVPETPVYSRTSLALIIFAVFVKIALGLYVKSSGKKVNSSSLLASGQDALMDSIVSASTVVAAFVFLLTGFAVEAYLGVLISLLIVKSGIELIKETVSEILGERIDGALSRNIKETVRGVDSEIRGAYDLILNDYGPERLMGSVHIEVPSTWSALKIDSVTRKIRDTVFEKHNIILSAVGIYSINTENAEAARIRENAKAIAAEFPEILQIHGFFADIENKKIRFDVVVSFSSSDMNNVIKRYKERLEKSYPDFDILVQLDHDISD